MTILSGRIKQSPVETKRYVLDYTSQLAAGESVTSIATSVTQLGLPLVNPPVVLSSVVIGPGGLQVIFYVSGGVDGNSYEADFQATTSLAQNFEDVIEIDIGVKT